MGFAVTLQVYFNWLWVSLSAFTVQTIFNIENNLEWMNWCMRLMYGWCITLTRWYILPSTIAKVSSCLWDNV